MAVGWNVSRVLFATGYTDTSVKNGGGRARGFTFWVFQLGLVGLVGYMGVKMVT